VITVEVMEVTVAIWEAVIWAAAIWAVEISEGG